MRIDQWFAEWRTGELDGSRDELLEYMARIFRDWQQDVVDYKHVTLELHRQIRELQDELVRVHEKLYQEGIHR